MNPNDVDAYIYRGNAYLARNNSESALADFNKAIELNSNDAEAYIIRGDAYLEQGNLEFALADFDKAVELDPNNANTYVIRGKVYRKNGDLDSAIEDYKKAIELNLDDAEAYCNLGFVCMEKQNWQEVKLNLTVAKILRADIGAEFHNTYESIANFEQQNDIDLPEDIAAMLTA